MLEGPDRVLVPDPDLGLRGEVEDNLRPMLAEHAVDVVARADVSVHARHRLVRRQDRAARPVDVEPDHPGAGGEQQPRQPAAEEPGRAGDENAPLVPEAAGYCHVTQGAAPESLLAPMRYAVLGGGKRMRALLAYASGELTGGCRNCTVVRERCVSNNGSDVSL